MGARNGIGTNCNGFTKSPAEKKGACCVCSTRSRNPCFVSGTSVPRLNHNRTFSQGDLSMRLPVLLTFTVALLGANPAQARLFLQTYGSIVPNDGCGSSCTWNANQDFFVPRHCDSCRYGLFSPCKTSCTNSPACWWCHPLYPGYCGVYGPCHYHWRDHVYCCHCGCDPVRSDYRPWRKCCHGRHGSHKRHGCRAGCGGCATHGSYPLVLRPGGMLPNVEPAEFQVLGSLPVPGDELLASVDMSADDDQGDDGAMPGVLLPRVTPDRAQPTVARAGPKRNTFPNNYCPFNRETQVA